MSSPKPDTETTPRECLRRTLARRIGEPTIYTQQVSEEGQGKFPELLSAMGHATDKNSKLVRPLLTLYSAKAVSPDLATESYETIAIAIELVHTYSLIHDDLPAMDDDDMRRGKPSCHIVYGEAMAILAGDALQTRAFELIADAPDLTAEQRIRMVKVLASAAGAEGMVGGQAIDIESEGKDLGLEQLRELHTLKTGALIQASLALGGIAANASDAQLAALDEFGRSIGLAFQVVDDILDVEGTTETLGKTGGKDEAANKATYVKLMGLDGAKEEAQRLLEQALEALSGFDEAADDLRDIARYIVNRDH